MVGHLKQPRNFFPHIWNWLGLALGLGAIFWWRWRIVVRQPLWLDEVFTFSFAQLSWQDLITQTGSYIDYAHPTGFYLLTKLWLLGGVEEVWLRLPALVMALITAWLLYCLLKSLNAKYGKWVLLLYFAGHWLMVQLGSELRMYQAVLLVMLVVVMLLFRWWQRSVVPSVGQQLAVSVLLALAVYLDYAALWLLLTLSGVWLVAWWQRSSVMTWLGTVLSGVMVLISPQLWILATHLDEVSVLNQHLMTTSWSEVFAALHSLTGLPFGIWFGGAVVGLVGMFLYRWVLRVRTASSTEFLIPACLFLGLVLPVAVVVVASALDHPLVQQRNLLLVTLMFMVSFAVMVDGLLQQLQKGWQKVLIAAIVVLVLGLSLVTAKIELNNNWFWIRDTVARGHTLIFVGEHEYLMLPFLAYYGRYPTPLDFDYQSFSNVAALNQQLPAAKKILIVYEHADLTMLPLTKNDFQICSMVECEVMGVW